MTASFFENLTLVDARNLLARKKFSCFELTSEYLAKLKTIGRKLNIVASIDEDSALELARYSDQIIAKGDETPLLGIPLAHKDMFHRVGRESAYGSKIMRGHIPTVTATVLNRLDLSGALDIARLNMVEFALGLTGQNDITGPVLNPWNSEYIAGGSSSGSGAAVASGCILGALGSDTGGSIRLPSSCCGVVGMKPTLGRVSRFGTMPLSFSLDTIGPITKTVTDNATILQTIAGRDSNDPVSSTLTVPNYLKNIEDGLQETILAVPENYFTKSLSDEISTLFEQVLKVYEAAGAKLKKVRLPESINMTNHLASLITSVEGASVHQNWLAERSKDYGKQTYRRLANGLLVPATHYLDALKRRRKMLQAVYEGVFKKADALLAPVLSKSAPKLIETSLGSDDKFSDQVQLLGHCTRPVNYLGLPALTMPSALTSTGIPWAHQIIGAPFSEKRLYIIGRAFERETNWITAHQKKI